MTDYWKKVGHVKPQNLTKTRIQLHQSVQLLRAAGQAYLEAQSDDSHQNMIWFDEYHGLASNSFGEVRKYRIAVDFIDFELLFLNDSGPVIDSLKLDNTSRETAVQWVKKMLKKYGFDADSYEVNDDLIPAPEKPFQYADPLCFGEMAHWFENLNGALTSFAREVPQASRVRCWPHHFDLATLVTFEDKSVGVGLSPGDGYYDEPYLYITPWPFPDLAQEKLPKLGFGKYHRHEWNGIVLTGADIAQSKDQADLVTKFIGEGFKVARELINQ